MTLLSAVKRACALVSVTAPARVIDATGGIGASMREIAQIEGEELAARLDWREIRSECVFQATGNIVQYGRLPEDFGRMVPKTFWNRSNSALLEGPVTAVAWARGRSEGGPGGYPMFRVIGRDIHIQPSPIVGDTLAFEYMSKEFAQATDGSTSAEWMHDDDAFRLPERLLVFGLVWRWKHARGLDYAEDMANYERAIELVAGEECGEISTALAWDDDARPPLPSVIVAP